MTSVSSRGRSPISPYDFESAGETDDSWQYIEYSSGASNAASVGFLPSPASGSLNGYAVVGHMGHVASSPTAPSPLFLDADAPPFPSAPFPDQSDTFSGQPTESSFGSGLQDAGQFLTPQGFLFTEEQLNDMAPFFNTMPTNTPLDLSSLDTQQTTAFDLNIPAPFQSGAHVAPWDPTNLKTDEPNNFVMEEFVTPSPRTSSSSSPVLRLKSTSPIIKQEADSKSANQMRKVKTGKVEKKRSEQASQSQFLIVTPTSISAHAGKPNPFECFETMRTTQRGRKGPLANSTKESALQVRRLGACFCCHSRKVKCDKERPCKNCKKLMVQVPQVVCWQFQDFLTVLFPEFIRGHFKKDEMSKFVSENIEGFTVNGSAQECAVELFSGARLSSILTIRAKFFKPKTDEVLKHWHLNVGANQVELEPRSSAPIGIDTESHVHKDELKRKLKEYIHSIAREPNYAEQLTESFRHTEVPRKVLRIVQNYASQSDSPIVKKALSIYAMHYVMTRHLCLTRQTIVNLQPTKMVPQNLPWVTPRVLNRQVKAVVDELMMKEMQHLFDNFSKSLKPKSRREWAPCLAAFLVLCLFMEALEAAADTFVISQNEISMRNRAKPEYKRDFALQLNREVENMPFKQFAYQFHQVYLTHTKDASSKAFNPLIDDTAFEPGELDGAAVEMVMMLRDLVTGSNWGELDFLTMDPILPNREDHPFPRDVSLNYTGRLVAKFLLSFTNERYIFDQEC